jgi:hypothetical protein
MTTRVLTKNGVAVVNILDVQVTYRFNFAPGILEGAGPVQGFSLVARVEDVANEAIVTAQGPSSLFSNGSNPRNQYIGTIPTHKLFSKTGDTLQLTGVPGTLTAAPFEGASIDGFAP